MVLAATGILSQDSLLANLIASSSTFQELTGTDTLDRARQKVFLPHADDIAQDDDVAPPMPPRAIVSMLDGNQWSTSRTGTASWTTMGNLTFSIELCPPYDFDRESENANVWFRNKVGAIISELQTNQGTGNPLANGETHLCVHNFERIDGPYFTDYSEVEQLDPREYDLQPFMWMVFNVSHF